jgi:signal transduction histidine kinase
MIRCMDQKTENGTNPPYSSAEALIQSRQATLLQGVLRTVGVITFVAILLTLFLPGFTTSGEVMEPFLRNTTVILAILSLDYCLRRGWVMQTFFGVILFAFLITPYTIYVESPGNMQMLAVMIVPIALAGFLPRRNQFWWVFLATVVITLLTIWLIINVKQVEIEYRSIVTLIMVMTILALMTDGISSSYRQSIRMFFEQVQELQAAHKKLIGMNQILDRAVSDRVRAESHSDKSARTERLALDAAGAGILNVNLNTLMADLSADFLHRAGITVSPGTWDEFLELMQDDARHQLMNEMQLIIAGASNVLTGNFQLRGDTDTTWLVAAEVNRYSAGGVATLNGVLIDITEQIQSERQHIALTEKIKETQRLESLGILAGGIAHDFNNLLHIIVLNADMVRRSKNISGNSAEQLENLLTTANRAAELCSQLLAYSGKGQFVVEPFDLELLVTEMKQLMDVSRPAKSTIIYDLDDSHPVIEGDVTQIRQIVMNLITNAGEAIGDNLGTISISTSTIELSEESNQTLDLLVRINGGRYACIQVDDTGPGMDENTKGKIFDPFFSTKSSGRGLGLSAALGIVRGHQGSICITSIPGAGTSIKVFLPLSTESPLIAGEVIQPGDLRGEGKILLADDEEEILNLGRIVLSECGFEVIGAKDGLEALELFDQNKDDLKLAILDVMMPGKTGLEVYDYIASTTPDLPVILSSGYNEREAIRPVIDQDQVAFLKKPYMTQSLRDLVNKLL